MCFFGKIIDFDFGGVWWSHECADGVFGHVSVECYHPFFGVEFKGLDISSFTSVSTNGFGSFSSLGFFSCLRGIIVFFGFGDIEVAHVTDYSEYKA